MITVLLNLKNGAKCTDYCSYVDSKALLSSHYKSDLFNHKFILYDIIKKWWAMTINEPSTSLGAIGVSLNKQKLMYNILAPSIIAIYKFLCTYGGSVHIYM